MIPKYSFIIPVYNEEAVIPAVYQRIATVIDELDEAAEIIIINDGSTDGSINFIRKLQQNDERVSFMSLARNFGHQIAVTAGLNYVRGKAIIILDADLQDPPELVPAMIEKWKEGNEVVYAERTYRHKERPFKRFTAFVFYRILRLMAEVKIPTDTGDFCLINRKIVDILNTMPESNRYIRGLRAWVGFNQASIPYERDSRFAGEAKYTSRKSFNLAMNGIFSFSKLPLRFSTYLGLVSAAGAIIMAFFVLFWRIFQPHSPVNGFATILIIVFFLGAVQLISVGILGEYIGRIYEEVKRRPLYTINELGGWIRTGQTINLTKKSLGIIHSSQL